MNRLSTRTQRHLGCWLVFAATLLTYIFTLEPDASLWDCPEYLVTAALLEVGHPPGNPVWTLTARMFSLFGGTDPQAIAIAVNLSSGLFTAGAAGLLTSCLFLLFRLLGKRGFTVTLASVAGGLVFGWMDSPWYSAVEAEVYAMSLFLTALCVRLMLGWALTRDTALKPRLLLLTVYLTGLSIGVHQLNLLVLPALGLIWVFRRFRRPGFGRILGVLAVSAALVGGILLGFMPGVIYLAGRLELLCVNSWGMPFHSGVILFWILAMGGALLLAFIPWRSRSARILCWCPAMLLAGFSAYMLLLVRSAANPPMNEGAPATIFALSEYLARDQYGSTPLLYGRTPHSAPMRVERIDSSGHADYSLIARRTLSPRYLADPVSGRYLHYTDKTKVIYTPELDTWLPRLTSSDPTDIGCYADWAGMTPESMKEVEVSFALDSLGNPVGRLGADGTRSREVELKPTLWHQLRYFAVYQVGYMYLRYLLWNFSGRQNDRFATGEVEHGNFMTGIPAVDNAILGPQESLPDEIGRDNPGHNIFYMVPLLLGVLGMVRLQRYGPAGRRANLVIAVLFLMTGVCIVLYLNQSPREPRERDYSFLGSFWAYTVWVAAGIYAVLRALPRRKWLLTIAAMALPAWMLGVNYDDHDRSGRRVTTDFAANLLESLEPDAILFTNGDNFTFPLWWAQEVGGIRRDVTIINTAYLTTPWYIGQLSAQTPMTMTGAISAEAGIFSPALASAPYVRTQLLPTPHDSLAAQDAVEVLLCHYSEPSTVFPPMVRIADPENGADSVMVRTSAVASGSQMLNLRQIAALDIVATNAASARPRPVYWISFLQSGDFAGMYPLTARTLYARRLVYTDSLAEERRQRLLDLDFSAAMASRPGNAPHIYADNTVGSHITQQRFALLRLGGRLLAAGRKKEAMEVSRIIRRNYPASTWEYQIYNPGDSVCHEGRDLARLIMAAAESPAERAEGEALLKRERERYAQWRRYYEALPPHLRSVMTPRNRMKTSFPADD
ncbi:MAG: DUF2723 domain-containing protein [Bacteroides sp.]|nr:DUF2723 domain-containing protein [Bacteroides sp.]